MMMDDRRWRFRGRRARPPTLSFENENKVRTGRLNDLHSMVHLPISFGHYNISLFRQNKALDDFSVIQFLWTTAGIGAKTKEGGRCSSGFNRIYLRQIIESGQ